MAREMTGVGVKPSSAWMIVSTPLAASTSSAVRCAGAESACVSLPMNSGPSMPFASPVIADRLRDRENVRFVERAVQRRPAVAARAKADELLRIIDIRLPLVISPLQRLPDRLTTLWRRLAGQGMEGHRKSLVLCRLSLAV